MLILSFHPHNPMRRYYPTVCMSEGHQQVTSGVELWGCREDPGSLWGILGLWPAISKPPSPRFQPPSNSPASVASLLPAL